MQPVSQTFLDAVIAGGVPMVAYADVYRLGQLQQRGLPIVAGTVHADMTAEFWRTCSVSIVDASGALVPSGETDVLAPFGNEMKIWRGFRSGEFPGGEEIVPCGVFRFSDADVQHRAGVQIVTVDGTDRSRAVSREGLAAPYVIAAGSLTAAYAGLIALRMPSVPTDYWPSSAQVPGEVVAETEDPWRHAVDIALAGGLDLFFSVDGVPTSRPQPAVLGQPPVLEFLDGRGQTVVDIEPKLSDEGVYNHVIVTGQNSTLTGLPVRGEAMDTDESSPTWVGSAFGDVIYRYDSSSITDADQATAAAQNMLDRMLGSVQPVTFTCLPNPAMDLNDRIHVQSAKDRFDSFCLVESFDLPLTADAGPMTCRARTRLS